MTDRPIAAVLAALAAAMFRRRVLGRRRAAPEQRGRGRERVLAHRARGGDRGGDAGDDRCAPSLSRVAALPALHLPKARKPAKKKKPRRRDAAERTAPVTPTPPAATPTPQPAAHAAPGP